MRFTVPAKSRQKGISESDKAECSVTNSVTKYWINRASIKWDIKQLYKNHRKLKF